MTGLIYDCIPKYSLKDFHLCLLREYGKCYSIETQTVFGGAMTFWKRIITTANTLLTRMRSGRHGPVDYRLPLILFLLALTVRLAYMIFMYHQLSDQQILTLTPDSTAYTRVAQELTRFQILDEDTVMMFGIGYSAFLSVCFLLFGLKAATVIIVQVLLSSLSCALLYKFGKELTDSKAVGFIAGGLLAVSFTSISLANIILSETLFLFLFLAGNLLFFQGLQREERKRIIWAGIFLGLAVLVRAAGQLWPIMLLVFIIFHPRRDKNRKWREQVFRRLKLAYPAPLIVLIIIAGWIFRNYIVHDYPFYTFASAGGPANVATWAIEKAEGRSAYDIRTEWAIAYQHESGRERITRIDQYKMFSQQARRAIWQYPREVFNMYKSLVWENVTSVNELFRAQLLEYQWPIVDKVNIYLEYHFNYLFFWLGAAGILAMLVRLHWTAFLYTGCVFVYFALMAGFTHWQGSRLFYPGQIGWAMAMAFLLVTTGRLIKANVFYFCGRRTSAAAGGQEENQ